MKVHRGNEPFPLSIDIGYWQHFHIFTFFRAPLREGGCRREATGGSNAPAALSLRGNGDKVAGGFGLDKGGLEGQNARGFFTEGTTG
jgi:hypothetical protein